MMESVLIAYNNDPETELHSFFESCADDAKQFCIDGNHSYNSVYPPELTEHNVITPMEQHTICFIASHGDTYGIFNENSDDIISTRTTNYQLAGKVFYAVSCSCADKLMPNLKRIGLETFVGYDDNLRIVESEPMFREAAMEGLKALLEGDNKFTARERMFNKYNQCITNAPNEDLEMLLLHNREHLCFE